MLKLRAVFYQNVHTQSFTETARVDSVATVGEFDAMTKSSVSSERTLVSR